MLYCSVETMKRARKGMSHKRFHFTLSLSLYEETKLNPPLLNQQTLVSYSKCRIGNSCSQRICRRLLSFFTRQKSSFRDWFKSSEMIMRDFTEGFLRPTMVRFHALLVFRKIPSDAPSVQIIPSRMNVRYNYGATIWICHQSLPISFSQLHDKDYSCVDFSTIPPFWSPSWRIFSVKYCTEFVPKMP